MSKITLFLRHLAKDFYSNSFKFS